ncbi:MAG: RNA polymerase sigma factor [Candidatus Fervidibacter sp.]|uniref:RNA polymerase sigma factor n=1 Tax=Candidatus Fervidibacter sp. TaxID=3100871 RepID=UPI00404ABCCF
MMNEQHLLDRAKQGDYDAFMQLVEPHEQRLYNLALRITGSREDAEDVLQDTLLNALEHLNEFRGEAAFGTWLYRIAMHNAFRVLKKRRGGEVISLEELTAERTEEDDEKLPHPEFIAEWRDPAEIAEQNELRRILDEAVQQLPENYRAVFLLRDVEGLSTKEVAEILDISEGNVKTRLLRARLRLREILSRYFGDESRKVKHKHQRK